jgi:enoyl-CoA hydratase/carnithine racemase
MNTIQVRVEDRVGVITLNRPERLNAYTTEMGVELFGALRDFDRDDGVRAIVVTGAGRAFCAGADLEPKTDTFARENAWKASAKAASEVRPWNVRTPVIAAINGPAVGVGATLPLHWDIRIASEAARIGFVFVRRGIVPEANSTWILPRLIGASKAMELLLTGRILDAREALAYGLVSRVVARDELLPAAIGIGREIAENTSAIAVAITRRLVWRQLMETDPRAAHPAEDAIFRWSGKRADAAEGITAFLEKRRPEWKLPKSSELPDSIGPLPEPEDG